MVKLSPNRNSPTAIALNGLHLNVPEPFRFKQFSVVQSRAAMKVGFDGVLLGAWTAVHDAERILDIGTGTGIVALMLAQRNPTAHIQAIDIDAGATLDATENFRASPWADRLSATRTSLEEFTELATRSSAPFDLIVCNPPFHAGPKSEHASRLRARHRDSLPLSTLFAAAELLGTATCTVSVIVPQTMILEATKAAKGNGWHVQRSLSVRPRPDKPKHRELLEFERGPSQANAPPCTAAKGIAIECTRHQYTAEFRELTEAFYLSL